MNTTSSIDLLTPLKNLEALAGKFSSSEFIEGYLMGIRHAIELAEIQQLRIEAESKS